MISKIESLQQSKLNSQCSDSDFANQIQDAIAKIQITPDFTIVHSGYESLTVSDRYRDYLQQSSCEHRDRYLIGRLQQYLYAIFNGDLKPKQSKRKQESDAFANSPNLQDEIVNNANSWSKTKFFDRLVECNHSRGYEDADWLLVVKEEKSWQVSKNGLKIFIDPQQDLFASDGELQIGQKVSIRMPPHLVERGLYIAVGNAGSSSNFQFFPKCITAQLYFNVGSETALVLLEHLTLQFNNLEIPFDFKIPYSETDFARLDAPLLEFVSQDWAKVWAIVKDIYAENKANFFPSVPFFCKQIETGLGLAEKPYTKSNLDSENIGFEYCQMIAKAILKANQTSHKLDLNRLDLVMSYLSEFEIDWQNFYLSKSEKDSYCINRSNSIC